MGSTLDFEAKISVMNENNLNTEQEFLLNLEIERIFFLRGIDGDVGE